MLPIAPAVEKSGSYLNWEGRRREFGATLDGTGALPDCRVLDTLAVEMDADLFTQTPAAAAADLARLGDGTPSGSSLERRRAARRHRPAPARPCSPPGTACSTTARCRSTSRTSPAPRAPVVAKVAEATAQQLGLELGGHVTVATERGAITLPVEADDLPDGVVWLPTNSGDATVRRHARRRPRFDRLRQRQYLFGVKS